MRKDFGAYELVKLLGRGAAGSVYVARPFRQEPGIPRLLALKVMHESRCADPESLARFRHEAKIAVAIDSPHVATVFDTGRVGNSLFIAMELIEGWPLTKYLSRAASAGRKPAVEDTVAVFAGGLLGLHAIHNALHSKTGEHMEAVHRDISPKNLMIARDASLKLIDLGLGSSQLKEWETRAGILLGTPGYMAPEVVLRAPVDHRADLYSMGIILFEMLTVQRFIRSAPLADVLRASVAPALTPPSVLRPDVSRRLDDVVMKVLQPKPERRFQSAAELLEALLSTVTDLPNRDRMMSFLRDVLGDPIDPEIMKILAEPPASSSAALAPIRAKEPGDEETVIFGRRSSHVSELSEALPTAFDRIRFAGPESSGPGAPSAEPAETQKMGLAGAKGAGDRRAGILERASTVFDPVRAGSGALDATRIIARGGTRTPRRSVSVVSMVVALFAGTCTGALVARFFSGREIVSQRASSGPTSEHAPGDAGEKSSGTRFDGASVQAMAGELRALGAEIKFRHPDRADDVDGILEEIPDPSVSADVGLAGARLESVRRRLEAILKH